MLKCWVTQVKKMKISQETDGDVSDHNDAELVLSIEKEQDIQDELDKVNEEATEKVLEVEQKYDEICKPVYDKRNEIIKHIPHFLMTSFLSHPTLGDLLSLEDLKIFKFLDSVIVEDFKDMEAGYSITFENIKENEFHNVKGAAANGVNHEVKGEQKGTS
ncbi:NAP1-related protein 1-like [Impatiens glandulifera]|uniref:NAP1-related protein 1-like n=1 Tax=Impatiens glandulifera TaxID=253017 RepID=UPI001FB14B17|nr:NAP1-related protein 1-like [Impatiens glandulifera]